MQSHHKREDKKRASGAMPQRTKKVKEHVKAGVTHEGHEAHFSTEDYGSAGHAGLDELDELDDYATKWLELKAAGSKGIWSGSQGRQVHKLGVARSAVNCSTG